MLPNSQDTAPNFIIHSPDWSSAVRVFQRWNTAIVAAHGGLEQRQQLQSRAKFGVAYEIGPWTALQWADRKLAMMAESGAPVVAPVWPLPVGLSSMSGNTANLDGTTASTAFLAGGYALFEESGKASVFRLIVSVGATSLTLASGNAAYPVITPPSYTSAAVVYPCVVGMKENNRANWASENIESISEVVYVQEP